MYRISGLLLIVTLALVALAACAGPSGPTAAQPRPTAPATQPSIPPTIAPAQPKPKETSVPTPAGVEKTLYVAPQLRDCVGVAPMKCLVVREDPNSQWTNFFGQIEGFTFEPGFNYTLKVRVTDAPKPVPADASSKKYTLVEVVSKTQAEAVPPAGTLLTGTSWTLVELAGKPVVEGAKPVTAEFDGEGRVAGSAGCNRYGASYKLVAGQLSISQAMSTKMACMQSGVMEQEAAFLQALEKVMTFKHEGERLTLTTTDGQTLVFKKS